MNLIFQENGNLQEGVHIMTIEEFETNFGYNDHRKKLISGLKIGMLELKNCGCKTIFIDGSFVTKKEFPQDFDACWDANGINLIKLMTDYPTIIDYSNERKNQKRKYGGEFFPSKAPAEGYMLFIDFFQKDKNNHPKGIVQINLK